MPSNFSKKTIIKFKFGTLYGASYNAFIEWGW